ncbi:hypothetical protein [Haloarcula onubensis]|uniref:Uncharacterized protein n=1 Tax=Haloarcula onubensis TaxID=2950539 RepID=A0ABU2FVA7_9EURY|nr:hypothetical protein [Halomicroarcula sp. S3CR25-11]MDS0284690.1 hypothetical protein [Halomicroarcula sp. S3CR25-11]
MKSGSGADDPFEDFDDDDEDDASTDEEKATDVDLDSDTKDADDDGLPRIYERSSVKGERPEVIQLHVRQPTVDAEEQAFDDVKGRLENKRVYLTDFREAAYLVALEHLDEVEAKMSEWGYDNE